MDVVVTAARVALPGELSLPPHPTGVVVFAHASDSTRDAALAEALVARGFATRLFDLLTHGEAAAEHATHHLRFNIPLLANRLVAAIEWIHRQEPISALPVGVCGAGTAAAAALIASTRTEVAAIVSRAGRPDLAGESLHAVLSPTLLVVGSRDSDVLHLNRQAQRRIPAASSLHVVSQGDVFDDIDVAAKWFAMYLGGSRWLAEHAIRREI
jgi:dienelactone hydrolase